MEENITIFHLTISKLKDKIANHMKLGYIAVGEISLSKHNNNLYCQPMILKSSL